MIAHMTRFPLVLVAAVLLVVAGRIGPVHGDDLFDSFQRQQDDTHRRDTQRRDTQRQDERRRDDERRNQGKKGAAASKAKDDSGGEGKIEGDEAVDLADDLHDNAEQEESGDDLPDD